MDVGCWVLLLSLITGFRLYRNNVLGPVMVGAMFAGREQMSVLVHGVG